MNYIFHFVKKMRTYSGISFYVNIAAMAANSFLESVSMLLLVPLLGLIGIINLELGGGFFSWTASLLHEFSPIVALSLVLSIYISTSIVQNLINRKVMINNVAFQQKFSKRLRVDTYHDLLHANWMFFLNRRSSDLIHLLSTEQARVIGALSLFLQLLASVIFTMIQIAIAICLSPALTLFVLLCGVLLAIFSGKFIRKSKKLGEQTSLHAKDYMAGITDQINGMKDIKSNTLEQSRLRWLDRLTDKMMQEQLSYIRLRMNSQLLYKSASAILISGFILACFALFQTQGVQLLAITVIFARLWPRFTSIQSNLEQLASFIPACKAILELQNASRQAAEELTVESAASEPIRIEHGIECSNLSFRYHKDANRDTLQQVHIRIPANGMTAIAGASGAGKSTLIDLVMGLLQPDEGQIKVDGVPITRANLFAYRQSISYVPQEPFLFHASIRENIQMLRPDASDEQIWEALEFASSSDFVRKLPEGLDTVIGDRGVKLSGGERQRLVLARAVIRKPSILVLDEATSSLDSENETNIQEAIDRLKGHMTIIVVAHRLSTIRNADKVIVLDQGRVAEQGEFSRLAADPGSKFGQLLQKQGVIGA
ncbi:ABC transporter ATP-binding protein [Paenibacillus sp. HB172176]|uniref:ABC transporter ATP-binding protein n=1 Tax=Paenibacillus sp. HB172176 TaxID=2493690 RepID=UPI0014388D20|nr:ABC transporter ATP-binding protein [Paenibacillus sp. HB172176]